MYDQRRKMDREVRQEIKRYVKDKMFNTLIRKNVKLAESLVKAGNILKCAPRSYGAQDYFSLAKEVIEMEKK